MGTPRVHHPVTSLALHAPHFHELLADLALVQYPVRLHRLPF